jgi:hypothetical protein
VTLRLHRWSIVPRDELSYLRGVARGASKMQRSATRGREVNEALQKKLSRLREQIACDQEYIDALEEVASPEDLKRIRRETAQLRHRRALA